MAKIEMDLSEFKIMEDNKRLLEESLKREKEQNDKIEAFKQEKIDILKSNEKSVTIVKRIERTDLIRPKINSDLILNRLQTGFNRDRNSVNYKSNLDTIIDGCFEVSKVESFPPEEEVTIKGLNEVTDELRADIIKGFDKEINNLTNKSKSLKSLNEILESNSIVAKQQLLDTTNSLNSAEKDIIKLATENIEYEEYVEILELQLENYNKIKKLLSIKINIFNYRGFFNKIKDLIK